MRQWWRRWSTTRWDIGYLGGFTYVQAAKRAGVKPLVQRERDRNFHSLFITQPDSSVQSLADLKGHSFAFGDVNSTSGHLMPEYFMRENKVHPDVIARALYTGGHDATLLAVANGKVDAGALDEAVFERMTSLRPWDRTVEPGKVDPAKVRVFWTTPPFFAYVWWRERAWTRRSPTLSRLRSSASTRGTNGRRRSSSRCSTTSG
jgi:phosphonate transport system substrate-binding protein